MGFILYGGTVMFSIIVENLNKCKYVKKLADTGYKIENFEVFNLSSLVNLIPLLICLHL